MTQLPSRAPKQPGRLESFRGRQERQPIDGAERAVLWFLGAELVLLPWALGAELPWAQIAGLALAAAALACALVPRYRPGAPGEGGRWLSPWRKLSRFPIFWLGGALLALVTIQALNPAWTFTAKGNYWWVLRARDVPWLPAGVAAPFGRFNAWRDLIIGASTWFATCAVWVGLIRQRSLRLLLGILTANGIALSALEAWQHLNSAQRIPWPLTALTMQPLHASFVYKNHAGSYLTLTVFCALALAAWNFRRGARTMRKSTPTGVLVLAALLISTGVLFTLSKGASLLLGGGALLFAGWWAGLSWRERGRRAANPAVTALLASVFLLLALYTIRRVDFSEILAHFDELTAKGAAADSVRGRIVVHRADGDMLRDHWLRGVGAGGFRYLFPEYQRRYPEIYLAGALYWEHAHGDWWEVPIELGLAGDLLLLAGTGWWIAWFSRHGPLLWNVLAIPLLLGCGLTVMHAEFDFPFQSPAILITWAVLLTVAGRVIEE